MTPLRRAEPSRVGPAGIAALVKGLWKHGRERLSCSEE
jgi:hypothetical protein